MSDEKVPYPEGNWAQRFKEAKEAYSNSPRDGAFALSNIFKDICTYYENYWKNKTLYTESMCLILEEIRKINNKLK